MPCAERQIMAKKHATSNKRLITHPDRTFASGDAWRAGMYRVAKKRWLVAVVSAAAIGLVVLVTLPGGKGGVAAVLPGDINSDNKVDVTDLSILLANYGKSASQATNPASDINGNGTVDISDLSALLSNYGKTNSSGVYISEDFSNGASAFTPSGGSWSVSGGRYLLSTSALAPASVSAGLSNKSVHSATVSGDFTLTADVQATQSASPWDDAAIIFGYQDANNYYIVLANESNDQHTHGLFRVQNDIKTELADLGAPIAPGQDQRVKITRHGQSIQVYLNDQLRASANDNTYGAGKAGFGSWDNTASFDNLRVVAGVIASPLPTTTPTPGPQESPISLHPQNRHYFQFRGKPTVLLTASEHYGAVLNSDFNYTAYLNELQAKGLNKTRTFTGAYVEGPGAFGIPLGQNTLAPAAGKLIAPWARSNTPGYINGGNKFDLNAWNPAYFARLKDFVAQAGQRGIVVEIVFFSINYNDEIWHYSPLWTGNNVNGVGSVGEGGVWNLADSVQVGVRDKMIQKIVTELNPYDNVYYEIVNEYGNGPWDIISHYANVVTSTEASLPNKHLIAMHLWNDPRNSVLNFHDPNLVERQYNGAWGTWDGIFSSFYSHNKVIGFDETLAWDNNFLLAAWEHVFRGGAAFDALDIGYTVPNPTSPAKAGLRTGLGVLGRFVHDFNVVNMSPNNGVVVGGVPSGATARALVEPGRQYAVWVRGGSQANLVITMPSGTYRADWVDTASGTVTKSESFAHGGGNRTISSPQYGSGHAALRVKAQ